MADLISRTDSDGRGGRYRAGTRTASVRQAAGYRSDESERGSPPPPSYRPATEAGLPGLTFQASLGPLAPAGTPGPIIEQIAQATRTALADPAFQQTLISNRVSSPCSIQRREVPTRLESDIAFWAPVVKALGLKID